MKCFTCGNETTNPKFCSRSCSATYTGKMFPKRKIQRKCSKCDNKVRTYKHTLCAEHWAEHLANKPDVYRNRKLKEYWNKDSLKNLHPSSKNAHIRLVAHSWFKKLKELPCANCGYTKHVELCHIKPISSFTEESTLGEVNHEDNIIQLCPNCHWELDKGLIVAKSRVELEQRR